jgi:phosphate transport system protein
MSNPMLTQMDELNRLLLQMATLSEEMVVRALEALELQNVSKAKVVIVKDREIDQLELEIDRYIFDLMALHQPVAADLRLILSAQKINNDLERVADHAVNIAESAIALSDAPHIKPLVNIPRMARVTREMLKEAIDSFVYRDPALAQKVSERDDEIDTLHLIVQKTLADVVQSHPQDFGRALRLFSVSTDLERIADLATNIAEEVVFITEAEVVKHQT